MKFHENLNLYVSKDNVNRMKDNINRMKVLLLKCDKIFVHDISDKEMTLRIF